MAQEYPLWLHPRRSPGLGGRDSGWQHQPLRLGVMALPLRPLFEAVWSSENENKTALLSETGGDGLTSQVCGVSGSPAHF